jgi:ankyrin repeat protein
MYVYISYQNGVTLLHCAAQGGQKEAMKLLIDKDAKIDGKQCVSARSIFVITIEQSCI